MSSDPPPQNQRTPFLPPLFRRAAVYGLCFVLLPVALLVCLELGLRLVGFGFSTSFFLHRSLDSRGFLVTNKAFYQQFFSEPIDNIWEGSEWQVPDGKPEKTCRVFIFGSSAAQGWPDPAYSFWRILDMMLQDAYPGMRFEVYSAAHPGVNSHVMRIAAEACARAKPDFYVVYMGNNEVNGPFGAVNVKEAFHPWSLCAIQAQIAMKNTRLMQLAAGAGSKPMRSNLVSMEQFFRLDDPRMAGVERHFQKNLDAICSAGTGSGADVVLSTVGTNLRDWFPHTSLHRPDLSESDRVEWEQRYQQGVSFEEQKHWDEAIRAYASCLELDAAHAECHFRLAACLLAQGNADAARDHYLRAWENDAFRSRVLPSLNGIIREEVARWPGRSVVLADAAKAYEAGSPQHVPGQEFFTDNCHMTFEGNYLLASVVFEQMKPLMARRFPEAPAPSGSPISVEACRKRLALTPGVEAYLLRLIINSAQAWKWRSPPEMTDRMLALEREAGPDWVRGNAEAYANALKEHPGDYYLRLRRAEALLMLQDIPAALEEAHTLLDYFPYRRDARRTMAVALARSGQFDQAKREFETVLALYPDDAETYLQLGMAEASAGHPEPALRAYRRALALNPKNEQAKCAEARVLAQSGDAEGAIRASREAIRLTPRKPEGYDELDALLQKLGNGERAIREWQEVVRELPDSPRSWFCLGRAFGSAGRHAEAVEADKKAAALDSLDPAIHTHLGLMYLAANDPQKSIESLKAALHLNPGIEQAHRELIRAYLDSGDLASAKNELAYCRQHSISVPEEIAARVEQP